MYIDGNYIFRKEEGRDALVEGIRTISNDINFLYCFLLKSTGHSFLHINKTAFNDGFKFRVGEQMTRIINEFEEEDSCYDRIEISDDIVNSNIKRLAVGCVDSSCFVSLKDALYSLRAILCERAKDIADWVFEDEKTLQKGRRRPICNLTCDAGRFVGAGISKDGNEYVTSSVRIILGDYLGEWNRLNCCDGYNRIPFCLTTIFPDISKENTDGSLCCTGRWFGNEIAQKINASAVEMEDISKIYWKLKGKGWAAFYIRGYNSEKGQVRVLKNVLGFRYRNFKYSAILACRLGTAEGKVYPNPEFVTRDRRYINLCDIDTYGPNYKELLNPSVTTNPEQYKGYYIGACKTIAEKVKVIAEDVIKSDCGNIVDNADIEILFPRVKKSIIRGAGIFYSGEYFSR